MTPQGPGFGTLTCRESIFSFLQKFFTKIFFEKFFLKIFQKLQKIAKNAFLVFLLKIRCFWHPGFQGSKDPDLLCSKGPQRGSQGPQHPKIATPTG